MRPAARRIALRRVIGALGLRGASLALALGALALASVAVPAALAQERVRADLAVQTSGGYARLVFAFGASVSPQVRVANGIIVLTASKPVALSPDRLDKLPTEASGYISVARADPDGLGLRFALGRKVTVNVMEAGERIFVDLLPDGWTGLPPGLPQEVVAELARRAEEAERKARQLSATAKPGARTVKLRVAHAPTFSRFAFQMPEGLDVATQREEGALSIIFDGPVAIDLGEARAKLPPTVSALELTSGEETASIRLVLEGDATARTFREEGTFAVDIVPPKPAPGAKPAAQRPPPAAPPMPRERPRQPSAELAAVDLVQRAADEARPNPSGDVAAPVRVPMPAPRPAMASERQPPAPKAAPPVSEASAQPAEPAATQVPGAPAAPARAPAEPAPAPAIETQAAAQPAAAATPAASASPPPAAAIAPAAPDRPAAPGAVVAQLVQSGGLLKLTFPFAEPTAAAVFRRGEVLWLVFDSRTPFDVAALEKDTTGTFRDARVERTGAGGTAVRLRLERPRLVGAEAEGLAWSITLGDAILEPTRPVSSTRALGEGRSTVSVSIDGASRAHRLQDADAGDALIAVTATGPTRGILRPQDFVEFALLATTHGVAVRPNADDLMVDAGGNKVAISRPGGLVLSPPGVGTGGPRRVGGARAAALDPQIWGFDRSVPFHERLTDLLTTAANAGERSRQSARLDVARFYLARGFAAEARGALDVVVADASANDDPTPFLLRALAWIDLGRTADAMKDLSHPQLASSFDAATLRGIVHASEGRWREARQNFAVSASAMATLPIEVQRRALAGAIRSAIEVSDATEAARLFAEFETMGVPPEMEAEVAVLAGRLAELAGRPDDAVAAYRRTEGTDRGPAAAEARLRQIMLRETAGEADRAKTIHDLEGLSVTWRGDRTEIMTLDLLSRRYVEAGRFRDAFRTLDAALIAHPNSDVTRDMQRSMTVAFADLFLDGRGDGMAPLDALALFYDYARLIPIGRRGDEMIRRLADRLVAVDLLDQASELLQHQVDERLQGAARAQVASKLALIHLKNRKPDLALKTLRTSRMPELPQELREARLMLEARALSETGRHDLAIELAASLAGKEADRLRADIHWAAKHWREAAEAIEGAYGERWKGFAPLADHERHDILRAAIGYALAEDRLGLERFRARYGAKMAQSADRLAFEAVTMATGIDRADFREVARNVASFDSLSAFLRDYRSRYGDGAEPPAGAPAEPAPQTNAPPPAAGAAPARS